jgi:hypothetical protein
MGDDAEYYIEQQEEGAGLSKHAKYAALDSNRKPFCAGQTELDMRMKYGVGNH